MLTWNVAGLRGFLKRDGAIDNLRQIVKDFSVDVVCLQETKLQEMHVEKVGAEFLTSCLESARATPEHRHWDAHFSCSVARKGYSGVVTAWNTGRIDPIHVVSGGVDSEGDAEGRTVTLSGLISTGEDDREAARHGFTLVNTYVPNSGQGLKRLQYRTEEWDHAFANHIVEASVAGQRAKRVAHTTVVTGDFNVAFHDIDHFDAGDSRSKRYPGRTPQEKASAQRHLLQRVRTLQSDPIWVDAFRARYPHASGVFSYWSQRSRNRQWNRGLRLDTFLVDEKR